MPGGSRGDGGKREGMEGRFPDGDWMECWSE